MTRIGWALRFLVIPDLENHEPGCYVLVFLLRSREAPMPTPAALQNIVVATDFSPASETALLYALGMARRSGAKVWIAHVVGDAFLTKETQQRAVDDAWREGHRQMTEHFISGRLDGVPNQLLVKEGSVTEVLVRLVEEHHAELLVLGTRGRSRIGKLFLGSIAESIFRQAPCPVLTVGPRVVATEIKAEGPRKILFCTGFSKHSLAAGATAVRIAARQQAELLLLHVGSQQVPGSHEDYARHAEEKLRKAIPPDAGLTTVRTVVRFGLASEQILQVAQELQPDLIVLGVRQPESFARRLRWATAYEVVSNAPCPVLTVRTQEP
jgi:nucleotide-binding universal stress UspA family protein